MQRSRSGLRLHDCYQLAFEDFLREQGNGLGFDRCPAVYCFSVATEVPVAVAEA